MFHVTPLTPENWQDYELIDSGGFKKLERFGACTLIRPEPQALWSPHLDPAQWRGLAQAEFVQKTSNSGDWQKFTANLADSWTLDYRSTLLSLKFRLALTRFKHVGIFPEQASNWEFIAQAVGAIPACRVLNLFAYTGGASLAARAAGAQVTHVDSVKQVVTWARQNMEASGQTDIRWIVDDVFKFVKREARRNSRYHGIILDPPAYGLGPKGERWKLEDLIGELLQELRAIIEPENNFMVFNAYSLNLSPVILGNLLREHFPQAQIELGELTLLDRQKRPLPAGVVARFRS